MSRRDAPGSLHRVHGLAQLAGLIGLFATRPLADIERARVRDVARGLDFTGVSRRDVWEDDCLIVVRVHHTHSPPLPVSTDAHATSVIFDGAPRLPDGDSPAAVPRWLSHFERACPDAFLRLDGSFAIVVRDVSANRITLVTDRFNSRPLYYRADADILAFASQAGLLLRLPGAPLRLDPVGVMEFLAFQTILDERTFLSGVSALPPASHFDFPDGPRPPRQYWSWRPPVDDGQPARVHAERLMQPLVTATKRMVGDGRGLALLLSGGLDARAVVACAPRPLAAVTLGDFDNTEVKLARAIAHARGFPFTFVRRHPEHHVKLLDLAVSLGDGTHRYDHAHFAYLRAVLPPEITALATAYGFDRYLKGNSLPRRYRRLRGWPLHGHELLPLPADLAPRDLARTMLSQHAHFLWGSVPLGEVLREPYRSALEGTLVDTLEGMLRRHWDNCPDAVARFEAATFHMLLSRHTAYLNVLSIRHFFEDRVLLIDNALFDAAIGTPPRLRVDGDAYRGAMRRLAPDLWRIPDGNTGMPPDTHVLVLHARDRTRELRRRLGLGGGPPALPDPAFTDESWPNLVELLRHRPVLAERLAKTLADPAALPPDLIDSAAAMRLLKAHLAGQANHAWLLLLLLTFGNWHRRNLAGRGNEADMDFAVGPAPLEVMQ
jgi:asparagine synthase (glutamine-hydrolysing)